MQNPKPFYFIPPTDPMVANYNEFYVQIANPDLHTAIINVEVEDVHNMDCGGVQSMIMALQHHPHLIEKMIFSYEFHFAPAEDEALQVSPDVWKGEPAFIQWFNTMLGTPFILFFIADEDARYFTLMGDMIISGELDTEIDERDGRTGFGFNEAQGQEIVRRVWGCCLNMMHFCYGSGFDPRMYIEGMMALLEVQFTYEELEKEFTALIEKGAFKVVAKR